jgi:hypothetical protein
MRLPVPALVPVPVPAAVLALALAATAHAQEAAAPPISVELVPPARVVVGARDEIVAHVTLGEGTAAPLLVTPTSEGPAIEIVRGRLLRADGVAATDRPGTLLFRIPFVARTQGTAVVHVRVDGFACAAGRCRALQIERTLPIDVEAAPP